MILFLALSSFGQDADSATNNITAENLDSVYATETIDVEDEAENNIASEETITEEKYTVSQDTISVGDSTFVVKTVERYSKSETKTKTNRKQNRQVIRCEERLRAGMEAYERNRFPRAVNYLSLVRNECSGEIDDLDSIYFFLGLSYMKGRKYEDARIEFRTIIEEFPHSEFIEQTYYLLAYSSFKSAPIVQRDNRLLRRAEREFSSFISGYPNSEWTDSARVFLDSINDKLLEKDILVAEFYEIIRKYESAVIYYETILEDYVGNSRIPEIRLRLAKNLIKAQRFAEAEDQFQILEKEHLYQSEIDNLRRQKEIRSRRRS